MVQYKFDSPDGYLVGQLLIAMPNMQDERFQRSVIYVCAHSEEGAMGIVLNRLLPDMSFMELLHELDIAGSFAPPNLPIHVGGPVETSRGFVLHSAEYERDSTVNVDDDISLTASLEIVRDIAVGRGPKRSLMALGYSGWGPGQLDEEIQANGWLSAPATAELVFGTPLEEQWERAVASVGATPGMLSGTAGRA